MNNPGKMKGVSINGRRGQNVVEYLLLTVAVVIVLFSVLNTRGGPMKSALDNILDSKVQDIKNLNSELKYAPQSN